METVYIDVLFLVNVTFDLIAIYITSCICSVSLKTWRCLLSCVIGGIYGVWGSVWCRSYFLLAFSFLLVTSVMCVIAFSPAGIGAYAVCYSALVGSLLVFGSLSYYFLIICIKHFDIVTHKSNGKALIFAVVSTLSGAMLGLGSAASKRRRGKKTVKLTVRIGESRAAFLSMSDTGNILRDPMSGMPVIILSFDLAQQLMGRQMAEKILSADVSVISDSKIMKHLRIVPFATVNGRALMWCIIPDEIRIDGIKKEALIGISEKLKKETSICPASLL